MIKVIKEGKAPRGQVTCSNCHSILEYGNADLHEDWRPQENYTNYAVKPMYLTCPVCGMDVSACKVSLPPEDKQ